MHVHIQHVHVHVCKTHAHNMHMDMDMHMHMRMRMHMHMHMHKHMHMDMDMGMHMHMGMVIACVAQAESLGSLFRNSLFPAEGGGFLRLHSTYRQTSRSNRGGSCGCSLCCCMWLQPLPPTVAGTTSRSTRLTRGACR